MNITRTSTGGYLITTLDGVRITRNVELTQEEADALFAFLEYEKDVSALRQQFSKKVTAGVLSEKDVDFALSNKEYVDAMIENIACGMSEWDMSYSEAFDAAFDEYGYPKH